MKRGSTTEARIAAVMLDERTRHAAWCTRLWVPEDQRHLFRVGLLLDGGGDSGLVWLEGKSVAEVLEAAALILIDGVPVEKVAP